MPVAESRFVAERFLRKMRVLSLFLPVLLFSSPGSAQTYSFGVVAQRNAVVTARYWNPVLAYAGARAGVELQLKVARSGGESGEAAARGEYDFVYSNHIFTPETLRVGYRVILRPRGEPISGQIVVSSDSLVARLGDLAGREVGFPSAAAFVGYAVPMEKLRRDNVPVVPVFGGNQEGTMAQLKAGRVAAAGVNGKLMRAYAEREGFGYRVLWESQPFHDIPVAAHPRVPTAVVAAVQKAMAGMADDAEGQAILAEAAALIGQKPPLGFHQATPADYHNYVEFYRGASANRP